MVRGSLRLEIDEVGFQTVRRQRQHRNQNPKPLSVMIESMSFELKESENHPGHPPYIRTSS